MKPLREMGMISEVAVNFIVQLPSGAIECTREKSYTKEVNRTEHKHLCRGHTLVQYRKS